ncbi:c-type cytochrome [Sphingobium indicum]|uniref:c-type cytochrome n=1 Tax=Sphingobium indicum TaxID=332055 RepID=UPI0009DA34CA
MKFPISNSALIFGLLALATSVTVSGQTNTSNAPRRSNPPSPLERQGERLFAQQCAVCHNVARGTPNKSGPTLSGMFGTKVGSRPGFNYSPALKGANYRWTDAKLDAFLSSPQKAVPGNRMPFAGIKSAESRHALVTYLKAVTR